MCAAYLDALILHRDANLSQVHLSQVGLKQKVLALQELIVPDLQSSTKLGKDPPADARQLHAHCALLRGALNSPASAGTPLADPMRPLWQAPHRACPRLP